MKHTKFKSVEFNNKKKSFFIEYTTGLRVECPYSALGIKKNVVECSPDGEVGNHSFYFVLSDGKKEYVPYDQILDIVQNPEYAKQQALYEMTKAVVKLLKESKVSKRELARRLKTSLSQIERLLTLTNYNKELSRLIEMAAILNYEFKWEFKKVA